MRHARRVSGLKLLGLWAIAIGLAIATVAQAGTQDITSQFAITRSGLVLNRLTNTFDSTITLKNTSGAPVLAPITVVVGALPSTVTLANQAGQTADGKPYVTPMAAGSQLASGGTLSFVLKFANPQRVVITTTLQVLYTVVPPPVDAPSLIRAVATDPNDAYLIGRVDGAISLPITLQAYTAPTCFLGTLVSGVAAGVPVPVTTDSSGYFGVAVSGIKQNAFVAIKVASPTASPLSSCLVSSTDNDSWPKAFTLLDAMPSARDLIDAPGKARWYKFSVTPGQRIQVSLTGLSADYTVAVFKDIYQAFLSQFTPATATTASLLKLTAEYAPSAFSPSAYSPSAFSPSAYSPSAYSPSAYSPSAYSPSAYSPSAYSPSAYSPSAYSPSAYSPSAFSPSAYSPSAFSPSAFSQTELQQAFSSAQTRSIIGVSMTPGAGDKSVVVNSWNNTGNFYIRVTGRGDAFDTSTPFTVSFSKGPTTCAGVTDTTLTQRPIVAASGVKTVILTDSSVLGLDDPLFIPGGGTLRDRLNGLATNGAVLGAIVDVASDARVTALKQQAANNPACPFAKNLVAQEIKGIVDSYRSNPLRYVVIVGNDAAIPFFRTPDLSGLGDESNYVPPVQSNSASEASLRLDFVLSQDGYGSNTTIALPSSDFPVPGLAVGRLVEAPAEIAGVIDAAGAVNGVVVPTTSLVTGYDFLEDAANAVKSELQQGTGNAPDTLITPQGKSPQDPASWTATQLAAKLFGSRHDVVFLAGHFSANSALAADFSTSLLTTDLVASAVDLSNSIVFSAGCHSGYNLVDADAIPGATLPLDWAQAFARKKATLVAGTGYQYGDTDFMEYSERLYDNFSRELRAGNGPISVGEALVKAKLDYMTITPDIRGIHEKVLREATLFGLPMLAVNMPAGRGSSPGGGGVITPVAVASGPAHDLGLMTADLGVSPMLVSHVVTLKNLNGGADVNATYLSGPDGVVTKPGEPALPLAAVNVTPTDPTLVLRGVGVRGGAYVDSAPMLPFSGAPTTELRGVHVPFLSPVFFPGRLTNLNYFGALAGGGGTELLVTPVQHRAANIADGTSTERVFTGLNFRLYYSGNLTQAALSDAPTIVDASAQVDAGGVLFAAQVVGDPAAAIHQVWVTYTGDGAGAWTSLDLAQCVAPLPAACSTEDSRFWKGRLASPPANLKYMVQAVNGVGLVSLDDNRGAYYTRDAATPAATTAAAVAPPTSAVVGDSVTFTTRLTVAGVPVAGRTVAVSVGSFSQLATTGSDGSVTVNLPVDASPGTYQVTVSFAGDDTFQPSSTTTSLVVSRAASTLTQLAPAGATLTGTLGGTTEALPQEPVSFSVTGPGGPLTISAITDYLGRATLPPPGLAAGNYTVTMATYAGNATYAGTSLALNEQFTVAKLAQSITFDPLADKIFGNPDFAVYATASSNLAVTFGASGACTVAANMVHLTGAGSCTVTADQAGDANTNPAPQVARTFAIVAAPIVVSLVRAQPSPTMVDSVGYTATFSEAVTGVAAGNFGVTTSGITGASVTSVSGGGTTWTVTVNTGRGTGSLRLDLVSGTGIVDAGSIPLAGAPFTGETYGIDKGGTVFGVHGTEGQPVAVFGSGGYALVGDVPVSTAAGAIAVLSDGRILVASTVGCDPQTFYCTLLLGRYLATGAPDASFGTNGRITTSVTNVYFELSGIFVNGDGTFLVGGIRNIGPNDVPFVAKFTSAGTPDASFGTNGLATLDTLPIAIDINGFAVDASGRSVIASSTPPTQTQGAHVFVARLTGAGALDATFGSGGVAQFAISSFADQGRSVAIQPDGKIVVGGRIRLTAGVPSSDYFLVLRIDASGALDPAFGTNGVATTRFASTTGVNPGRKLVLQPDGKIVLLGNLRNLDGTLVGCGIARFNADGTLDASYGSGGQVVEPRFDQGCFNVSLQPDGKTVIVGNATNADVNFGGFLRLLLSGATDPTFGMNGAVGITNYDTPAPVAVTSSGNLLTMLTVEDPADGVIKSYLVELQSTLAGPWLAQSISFNPLPDTSYGEPAFAVNASTSSGLPLSFTASGLCVVAGNMVQIGGVGNCTITAAQAGNATYFAATSVARTFAIAAADQAITFGPAPTGVTVGQDQVFVAAISSSPTSAPSTTAIIFSSLTPAVCTIDGSISNATGLKLLDTGQCTIAANQAGDANYNPAPQATLSFTVGSQGPAPGVFVVNTLNDGVPGSLRAAIAGANARAPGPNVVRFLPGLTGTIVLTSGQILISRSVSIEGPGADILTIDGHANDRIFTIGVTFPACPALEPGPDFLVQISGLRLTNGRLNVRDASGGAIYTKRSLVLDSVVIDNNNGATHGGGVAFWAQFPGQGMLIINSRFLNNNAAELMPPTGSSNVRGGALSFQDQCTTSNGTISDRPSVMPVFLEIDNSEFRGNHVQPATLGGLGGAISVYALADVTISDTRFVDNHVDAPYPPLTTRSYHGGAFEGLPRSLRIERSEIAENGVTDVTADPNVTRSGGIYLYNDMANRQGPGNATATRIVNSTVSSNASPSTAGAMLVNGNVALELDNSTVNGNSSAPTRTGGVAMSTGAAFPSSAGNTTPPTLKIISSILANNSGTGGDIAFNNALVPTFGVNAFNSLVQHPCSTCSLTQIFIAGPGNVIGADPIVGPLMFNGGTSRTHALLLGSPAINTGSNTFTLPTDQRGFGFPRVAGVAADMGAYESSLSLPIAAGTLVGRNLGLVGTAFLFDPTTIAGTLPSATVTGPPSWNGGSPYSCSRYQPPGTATPRSICWVFAVPVTGSYTAQGTVAGSTFTGVTSLDITNQLPAPQITNVQVAAGSVRVDWTAAREDVGSFLVRVNPVPFTGITGEMIVFRDAISATLTGLTLTTGATYQVNVFAFSQDLHTPDQLSSVFNISADSQTFVAP